MKTRWIVLLAVAIVIVVAGGITAIVVSSGNEADSTDSSDRVVIEFRAMPPAKVRVDGRNVGTTPMSLQYPRSTRTIEVEATMVRHLVSRRGSKDIEYKDTRTLTLDRDQLVDFKAEPGNRVTPKGEPPIPRDDPASDPLIRDKLVPSRPGPTTPRTKPPTATPPTASQPAPSTAPTRAARP